MAGECAMRVRIALLELLSAAYCNFGHDPGRRAGRTTILRTTTICLIFDWAFSPREIPNQ